MICATPNFLQLVPWLHLAGLATLLAVMVRVALSASSPRRHTAQSHRIHTPWPTGQSLHAMLQTTAYGV